MGPERYLAISLLAIAQQLIWGGIIFLGIVRKQHHARLLGFAYLVFMGGVFHDALAISGIISNTTYLLFISYPAVIFSFAVIVVRESSNMQERLALTGELESKHQELTLQRHALDDIHFRLNEAYSTTKKTYQELNRNITMARNVQQSITPDLSKIFQYQITVAQPEIREVSSVVYNLHESPEGGLQFFLAESHSSGIQGALAAMLLRSSYDNLAPVSLSPPDFLTRLNRDYITHYGDTMLTASATLLQISEKEIRYASAGQCPLLLFQNEAATLLEPTGSSIGNTNWNCTSGVQKLTYPWRVVLLNDSLYKALSSENLDSFKSLHSMQSAQRPVQEILAHVLTDRTGDITLGNANHTIISIEPRTPESAD